MTSVSQLAAAMNDDAADVLNAFLATGEGTKEERDTARKLVGQIRDKQVEALLNSWRKRSDLFILHVRRLDAITARAKATGLGGLDVLQALSAAAGKDFGSTFSETKFDSARVSAAKDGVTGTINDPPSAHPEPPAAGPNLPEIVRQPETLLENEYDALRDEYLRFFFGARVPPDRRPLVDRAITTVLSGKERYQTVGTELGVPWWLIGILHLMESSGNFHTHLHNGDPLTARTVKWPPDRPGTPPANGFRYTWEESARDALILNRLNTETNWSLTRALYRFEAYNGFGYRQFRVPSPYLWSGSTVWEKGKYTRDRHFEPNATSKQIGAAVVLAALYQVGQVQLYDDENEQSLDPVFSKVAAAANATSPIPAPATPSRMPSFDAFFHDHFPGPIHFLPAEFLIGGSQNDDHTSRCHGLNVDPPEGLWPNVVKLIEVLEAFRLRIDAPVKLLSVYRGPHYNSCIGGAPASQHGSFKAADFVVLKDGTHPVDWARILDRMRTEEKIFKGGLKAYDTFVHVDVRGENKNW